jgi:hypothetical protein
MNRLEDLPEGLRDDLSTKTIMVIDNGLFCEIAKTLSKSFKRTLYYCRWESAFPKSNQYVIGQGIEGIERVHNIFEHFDEVDCFVFPDIYDGQLQLHLESMGKLVFGGRMGEEMELFRHAMKEHMKKLDLYVTNYEIVTGVDNLIDYLKEHPNVWVKQNVTRGDFETFYSKNYLLIEPVIEQLSHNLGAIRHTKEFIVEDAYDDAVETGMDCYCIDGQFPSRTLAGIEVKDAGYVGRMVNYDKLPECITDFNDKMSGTLKDFGYKGFFSTEIRVSKKMPPYMVDFCARAGSPPNEAYQLLYLNLAEIIWYGAKGIIIDPVTEHKYVVECLMHSSWSDENWQAVTFPKKYRDNIKLRNACVVNGRYYCAPQSSGLVEMGAIVASGDTLKEAIDKVHEIAETVEGHYIEIKLDSLDKAQEEFDKLEAMGIKIL